MSDSTETAAGAGAGKKFSVGIVAGVLLAAAVAGAAYLGMRGQGGSSGPSAQAGGQPGGMGGMGGGSLPANHPPVPSGAVPVTGGAPGAPSQGEMISGRVAEVMQVPGYTYLKLQTEGGEEWAAVSTTEIKEGAVVVVTNAFPMQSFHSKTLQRTFDRIYFGSLDGR